LRCKRLAQREVAAPLFVRAGQVPWTPAGRLPRPGRRPVIPSPAKQRAPRDRGAPVADLASDGEVLLGKIDGPALAALRIDASGALRQD
jgi:hypothetical protein